MKGFLSKAKNIGTTVVDAASGAVDEVKNKMAVSEEKEMVDKLTAKMDHTGQCPVCGAIHDTK